MESDLSEVARRGSGSACRSLYGGFVEWQMGQRADGKDSVARQVAPESHWPELRVLILVVSGRAKRGAGGPPQPPGPRAWRRPPSLAAGEHREEADGQHGGHADQRGDQRAAQGEAAAGWAGGSRGARKPGPEALLGSRSGRLPCSSGPRRWCRRIWPR